MNGTTGFADGAGRKNGFSLVEILAALVITVVVAAFVIPMAFGKISDASVDRQSATLTMLAQATMTYHDQVGMWPGSLKQLTTVPAAGDLNLCGNAMAAKDVAKWQGPYVSFPITGDISIEGNTILAALARNPAASSAPGELQISLEFTTTAIATSIQTKLDTDASSSTGVIQWTGSDPNVVVTYNLPVTGC